MHASIGIIVACTYAYWIEDAISSLTEVDSMLRKNLDVRDTGDFRAAIDEHRLRIPPRNVREKLPNCRALKT